MVSLQIQISYQDDDCSDDKTNRLSVFEVSLNEISLTLLMLDTSCIAECLMLLGEVLVFETGTRAFVASTLISGPPLLGAGIAKAPKPFVV